MARYSAGALTTAGSTTLPIISLYSAASVGGSLRAVGLTNTTSTAVYLKLVRLTSAGTPGAGLTEGKHNPDSPAASCTAFTTHSANPSLGDDLGYRWALGAAVGAGLIETFGDTGFRISTGTANGIGVIVESGTGQPIEAYLVWDE
jgi:hypothetical protein